MREVTPNNISLRILTLIKTTASFPSSSEIQLALTFPKKGQIGAQNNDSNKNRFKITRQGVPVAAQHFKKPLQCP